LSTARVKGGDFEAVIGRAGRKGEMDFLECGERDGQAAIVLAGFEKTF
jgi:hypothetical protein